MTFSALVHSPPTKLDTAYGSAVVPIVMGLTVAQEGIMVDKAARFIKLVVVEHEEVADGRNLDDPLVARRESIVE